MTLSRMLSFTLLAAALAAGIARAGLVQARAVADPLQGDPAEIRVELALPPGIGLIADSAVLRFGAANGTTGEEKLAEDALAEVSAGPPMVLALTDPAGAQLRAVQQAMTDWAAAGQQAGSAITVRFTPCALQPGANAEAPFGLWIRLAKGGPRLALVDGKLTLGGFLTESGGTLEPCP